MIHARSQVVINRNIIYYRIQIYDLSCMSVYN